MTARYGRPRQAVLLPDLLEIWGTSGSNVFAVGFGGAIIRYNGKAWQVMDSPKSSNLSGLWGSAPNTVFAIGAGATLLKYNGKNWVEIPRTVLKKLAEP